MNPRFKYHAAITVAALSLVGNLFLYFRLEVERELSEQSAIQLATATKKAVELEKQSQKKDTVAPLVSKRGATVSSVPPRAETGLPQKTGETSKASEQESQIPPFMLDQIKQMGDEQLAELESYVSISDDQREKLRKIITDYLSNIMDEAKKGHTLSADESGKDYIAQLKEVLGEAKYEQFQEGQRATQEARKNERFDQEVFTFSRKLSLTADQESQFRSVLSEVNQLSDQMLTDYYTQHTPSRDSHEQMLADYRVTEKMRREFRAKELSTRLQPILSESQFNTFLQEEAAKARTNPLY